MASGGTGFEVEVFRGAAAEAREHALVLRAKGIQFASGGRGAETVLLVRSIDAGLALRELELYRRENVGWPPAERHPVLFSGAHVAAVAWAATLFLFSGLERTGALGLPWRAAGQGRYDALRAGELWRAVTSLTLHVDLTHLLSNSVFGGLFLVFVAQLLGPGFALAAVFASGALGNLLALVVRTQGYSSVGASTSVFAAIGVLVALQWLRKRRSRTSPARRWTPILMGLVFLGYLGASGERTDFLAHAGGLAAGFGVGLGLPVADPRRHGSLRFQLACGAFTAALLAGAWALAFAFSTS